VSPARIGAGVVLAGLLAACQAANTPTLVVRAKQNLEDSGGQLRREMDQRKESLGLVGASLTGCSLERRQAFELDAEQEATLGQAVATRQLATLGVEPLPATDPVAHYVEQVGQYLALVAEAVGNANAPDRSGGPERALGNRPWPQAGYRFLVLPSDEPRATGGPGGTVMISTGFLRSLQSEEELAAVLTHEVVHVQRGHGVEVIKAAMCNYEARHGGRKRVPGELLGDAAEEAAALYREGFPKDFELEADRISVRILLAAGYDARALTGLLGRTSQKASARHPWRRMHPPPRERQAAVGERLEALGPARAYPPTEAVAQRTKRFLEAIKPLRDLPDLRYNLFVPAP
jgi:predicted Zn-dependent protease